uniref:Uncharacterized protein n=1 Tax=uncultured marine virus TaxID=186617 RepID=A0A0F7L9Y6_9VIRU|nr:hypothetical protein [uncultured marine virus]
MWSLNLEPTMPSMFRLYKFEYSRLIICYQIQLIYKQLQGLLRLSICTVMHLFPHL